MIKSNIITIRSMLFLLFFAIQPNAFGIDCREMPPELAIKSVHSTQNEHINFQMNFEGYQWAYCTRDYDKYVAALLSKSYSLAHARWESTDGLKFEKSLSWLEFSSLKGEANELMPSDKSVKRADVNFSLYIHGMNDVKNPQLWHVWRLLIGPKNHGWLVHETILPASVAPNKKSHKVQKTYAIEIVR